MALDSGFWSWNNMIEYQPPLAESFKSRRKAVDIYSFGVGAT